MFPAFFYTSVVGPEISFARIQGGRDLGINQWPWPGKMAALPLSCQSFLYLQHCQDLPADYTYGPCAVPSAIT